MTVSEMLLEIREYSGQGYRPLVDYDGWRVAVLNHSEELRPGNLKTMQRHNETDEVFVLLQGRCILFLGEGEDAVTAIHAEDMKLSKVYNVKRAVWHTHTLSVDAKVLIVENRDTTYDNSPFCPLTADCQQTLLQAVHTFWGNHDGDE